ncbi:MAG: hypothetical protein H7Z42_09625 [Roseiflexaceae bacterium]|nr:hypothetical protein [Roseiflexaceae bacterium]
MSKRRLAFVQLLRAVGLAIMLGALLGLPSAAGAAATRAESTADIVVQFGNGQVETKRITFTGTISGLEALRRTELALVEKSGAVCRIGDTGCAEGQECFCACTSLDAPCLFWSYQRWNGTAWVESAQGAGAPDTVANGAVEGWTWNGTLPAVTPALLGAQAARDWLAPRQAADGSYASGNAGTTIDSLLANRALGGDAAAFRSSVGASLLDALRALAPAYAQGSAAALGKLALGVAAADQDPRNIVGLDLVISMTATLDPASGAYGATNWDHAFSILGMRAAGEPVPPAAVALLKARASSDGGWGFGVAGPTDVDSTGLMLQALAAAGTPASDPVIVKALGYLDGAQNDDGGFPDAPASDGSDTSNANSSAFAVQGILAAGGDPLAPRWQPAATNPISYVLGLQQPDGAFTFGGQASLLATQQVIPALARRPFPYLSRATAQRSAVDLIMAQQQPEGSFAGFGLGSTIDALLAIDAAGAAPQQLVSTTGQSPLDYLRPRAAAYAAGSAAATGKLLTGLVAAGAEPRSFAGLDLVISATLRYDPGTGAYGSSTFDQAWSMIGLDAAGQSIPLSATARLQAMQATGGGWGFGANAATADADSTGLALMALAATEQSSNVATASNAAVCATGAGSSNPAVRAALAFLRASENGDGGFPGFDGTTSASASGLALQGLAAYHEQPRSLAWTTVITNATASRLTLRNPVDALLGLQTAAGGFPGFSGPNDPDATYQALPGLLARPYPTTRRSLQYLPVIGR